MQFIYVFLFFLSKLSNKVEKVYGMGLSVCLYSSFYLFISSLCPPVVCERSWTAARLTQIIVTYYHVFPFETASGLLITVPLHGHTHKETNKQT